jgi:hypothetical protein
VFAHCCLSPATQWSNLRDLHRTSRELNRADRFIPVRGERLPCRIKDHLDIAAMRPNGAGVVGSTVTAGVFLALLR